MEMEMEMEMDGFDRLPDPVILQIFDLVSDTKTLIRCLAVSKRFNSLVPHTDSLVLTVDRVISSDADSDSDSDSDDDVSNLLSSALRFILKSLHSLLLSSSSPTKPDDPTRIPNSPAQILRCFHRVRRLAIDLPSGDLRLEKGTVLKWRAEFGKTLRTCVILGFRSVGEAPSPAAGGEADFAGGMKVRVVWTISALIAASARHYLLKEVVREQAGLECLVLRDREAEGAVVMEKDGLRECREEGEVVGDDNEEGLDRCRTRVPSVRMRMRHVPRLELKCGLWVEGATLVVVRPSYGGGDLAVEDGELALKAFGDGVYGEVVQKLVKARSYLLEMNSF
ncbi:F-box protein AUF2 [Argentina anserina]|uniref:F-box protein AUF2 n=1 Tax=Argentina anserina TaxID=57926 RepID=UPI0021766530|nr:F-box protein AUF2 [Potentilla anserina]